MTADLTPAAADLAAVTTSWSDQWWDDDRALVLAPDGAEYVTEAPDGSPRPHLVPPTAWYAYALARRDGPGDRERSDRALLALLELQYDEPGTPWHGTFALTAEAPRPGPGAEMWADYDPNWRQFLGIAFLLLLEDLGDRLAPGTAERLRESVHLATRGEPPERCPPSYTNIALMKSWLLVEAGHRLDEPVWTRDGEAFARAVVDRHDRSGAFDEYNSPTYYGVDLFALALWRSRSSSALLRDEGTRLEASLWRDISRWYHAGLGNLCGPFTRAYGPEMHRYVAKVSLLLWCALGRGHAPLPPLDAAAPHGHDLFKGTVLAAVGTAIPGGAVDALRSFPGEHTVEQSIDPDAQRVATGWLGPDAALGAERSTADLSWWDQYEAATAHYRLEDGSTGWLTVRVPGPSAATVVPRRLSVPWAADQGTDATLGYPVEAQPAPPTRGDRRLTVGSLEVDLGGATVVDARDHDRARRVRLTTDRDVVVSVSFGA